MKPSWKVAFVAPAWTAWQHRLMAGALRYADAHPRIVVRGLAPVRNVAAAARELEQWGAQGLLGHMDYEDLSLFLGVLKHDFLQVALGQPHAGNLPARAPGKGLSS